MPAVLAIWGFLLIALPLLGLVMHLFRSGRSLTLGEMRVTVRPDGSVRVRSLQRTLSLPHPLGPSYPPPEEAELLALLDLETRTALDRARACVQKDGLLLLPGGGSPETVRHGCDLLARLLDRWGEPVVRRLAKIAREDPDLRFRLRALEQVLRRPDPEAAQVRREALQDGLPEVRLVAALADPVDQKVLESLARDVTVAEELRKEAAAALSRLRELGVDAGRLSLVQAAGSSGALSVAERAGALSLGGTKR